MKLLDEELLKRAKAGDNQAKEYFVNKHKGMIMKQALKLRNNGLLIDDLYQEGVIGLLDAIDKFDSSFNNQFITYATSWIRCQMLRALRNQSHIIKYPRHITEGARTYKKIYSLLSTQSDKEPTNEELAMSMKTSLSHIKSIQDYLDSICIVSLDRLVGECQDTCFGDLLADTNIDKDNATIDIVITALNNLTDREKIIISERFGLLENKVKSVKELADEYKVARETIRRWLNTALDKLRTDKTIQLLSNKGTL